MRVTLVHNPTAGNEEHGREALLTFLRRAGYRAAYQSTEESGWEQALRDPGDLVVAAGGDGTVRKVVALLAGRGVRIALVPLGTANNVSDTLGIAGPPDQLIAAWQPRRTRKFDVGWVRSPRGRARFVEAVGIGVFAKMMSLFEQGSNDAGQELMRARRCLRKVLARYPAFDCRLELDGRDLSGRYLMVEAMNIRAIGPNLQLVPGADPGDGLLDLVLVPERSRGVLDTFIAGVLKGNPAPLPLSAKRGQILEVRGRGLDLHLDDQVVAGDRLSARLEAGAVELIA
ncbi:MAG: diacylglycerol/lipid kinase family protein [Longimicrobiaceae bacterium]